MTIDNLRDPNHGQPHLSCAWKVRYIAELMRRDDYPRVKREGETYSDFALDAAGEESLFWTAKQTQHGVTLEFQS